MIDKMFRYKILQFISIYLLLETANNLGQLIFLTILSIFLIAFLMFIYKKRTSDSGENVILTGIIIFIILLTSNDLLQLIYIIIVISLIKGTTKKISTNEYI